MGGIRWAGARQVVTAAGPPTNTSRLLPTPQVTLSLAAALAVSSDNATERSRAADALQTWASSPGMRAFLRRLELDLVSSEASAVGPPGNRGPGHASSIIAVALTGTQIITEQVPTQVLVLAPVVKEKVLVMGPGIIAGIVLACVVPVAALAAYVLMQRQKQRRGAAPQGGSTSTANGGGAASELPCGGQAATYGELNGGHAVRPVTDKGNNAGCDTQMKDKVKTSTTAG